MKVGKVGRIQTPAEKRETMLAEYDRSGMTGAQVDCLFCCASLIANKYQCEAVFGRSAGPLKV